MTDHTPTPGEQRPTDDTAAVPTAPDESIPATPAADAATPATSTTAPTAADTASSPAAPAAGGDDAPPLGVPETPAGAPPAPEAPPAPQPLDTASAAAEQGEVPAASTSPRRTAGLPVVAALAVGALIGGAAGAGVAAWAVGSSTSTSQTTESAPSTITVNNPDDVTAVTAIAAKAAPSVVTISASGGSVSGSGSGVILTEDGYILTNNHVVTLDGATATAQLEVTTSDGHIYSATIVGTDAITDLAVIKLEDASGLTPIDTASSSELNVGDRTVVIGAPLGLSNSVSDGIVSALNRSISVASSAVPDDSTGDAEGSEGPQFNFDFPGSTGTTSSSISIPVIQTDAAVNPGNSGGALLNDEGELIGIIVAIASTGSDSSSTSGSIGVGFAIPSDLALRVAEDLMTDGTASHGLLGVTVGNASSDTGSTLGAVVGEVTPGSGADAAGIQSGDVITYFNELPITSATDITAQVRALAAGTSTTITVVRDEQVLTFDVTLGSLE